MKYFLRSFVVVAFLVCALHVARGAKYSVAENTVAASRLEQALYRLMTLPAGPVMARRAPSESRQEMDLLIRQSTGQPELYAIRAQEDERQLDFNAAEKDWKRAAELSKAKQDALLNLADFYRRRLQPQQEVQTVLRLANLPPQPEGAFKIFSQQPSWMEFRRALETASESKLPPETRNAIYEAWIKRYPRQTEPYSQYFEALVLARDRAAAGILAARIRSTFADNLSLRLTTDSQLAELDQGPAAALGVYDRQFSVLWPTDLRSSYFAKLSSAHQLRAFLSSARNQAAANPTALDPVLRVFFYYEQQGKKDVANQQLLELGGRRAASHTVWTPEELKTLGTLFLRVADYDEASHAYYSLYSLPSASPADKALALGSLIDLLLDVPEQSLQFASRDLSIYRNVATIDRHPGFLNGILSLILNTTLPADQYQTASQTSVAYFHRAIAGRLIERMKREFPSSSLTAAREAKLFSAYAVYGQNQTLIRLVPTWLTANTGSQDYTMVALLLADSYAQTKQNTQEFALYDTLLKKLAAASGHHPLGQTFEAGQAGAENEQRLPVRSPDYAHVLDLYISRLTQLGRLTDAVALYRQEIDRNPDDPGIYERLALFVEQNHFDSDLEQTYRLAMKRFESVAWSDKLARFYLRRRQTAAYQDLTKELTGTFDGTKLAEFISAVPPGPTFSITLYREVNLYAHQRFPHNETFIRNLLASYQEKGFVDMVAYERLLRENWFYDAGLRTSFFEYLSRTGKLSLELAALPKVAEEAQQKNTAALTFYAEGKAWLTDFEGASPAFVSLSKVDPGDPLTATRVISVERSLAPSLPGAFESALQLAEQKANANPGDPSAATLVGEIYADRELFSESRPWWNKIATMRPGVSNGYLDSATVFWDYFQFADALRLLNDARGASGKLALYGYEVGAIHENQSDYPAAIDEYVLAAIAPRLVAKGPSDSEMEENDNKAERRLIQLARRKQTRAEIEQRTAALANSNSFNPQVFRLRLALLEDQKRSSDTRALLLSSLDKISDVDQIEIIQTNAERLGFDDATIAAFQHTIRLNTDPVEKLASRLALARFYQAHQDVSRAESEFAALLAENPALLGIVRANADFYWAEKQPKKTIATLEAAASRSQPAYRNQFLREAAQKAVDSQDFVTARRLLDGLLSSDPYNGDLLAAKASTYAREGDNKALLEFYNAQLAQLKAAPLSPDEKTQRTASLRRGYVGALITAKQFDVALEQYEALLNAYPEDEALPREISHFAEINHLTDKLTQYYEKATSDSPRDYRWPMILARIDISSRRYPEAIASLDKAVYVRPDRSDLYLAKVDLETRLLRFDAALKTYQKLYEFTYHDSQYLALQASLQARLGHNSESVRLLKAAYVDARPSELSGYIAVMNNLAGWRMYSEVDQTFQLARPLIKPGSSDYQRLATLEGEALIALRRPVDGLETAAFIRKASSDPKHLWNLQPLVALLGATIDDLFTPEEKAAFSAKLETPNSVSSAFNIYDLACASGFTDLAAKRLYRTATTRPAGVWRNLELLQSSRLYNSELARQLETLRTGVPPVQANALSAATLAAYTRAGDESNEIRLYQSRMAEATEAIDPAGYARLLLRSGANLSDQTRQFSMANPAAANQFVQELLSMLPEDRTLGVIEARGANISPLWTHSYSALAGVYYSSPKARPEFDAVLGPRTVGAQLFNHADVLRGAIWYYYASRFSDYLTDRKDAGSVNLRPAVVEANPIASNSYVALGLEEIDSEQFALAIKAYEQALELGPERADVHVLLAEAEHRSNHSQQSIDHLRIAFELLTKQISGGQQTPEYYNTAKTALTHMNQYKANAQLRAAADAMLSANSKRNQAYQFTELVEGILTDSPDRKAAVSWVLQLAHTPDLTGLTDQLIESKLLSESEKRPFYQANIDSKRSEVAKAAGEAATQAHQALVQALASYVKYLNGQGHAREAWEVLNQIEPKSEWPVSLLLETAATTGRLSEIFAQFTAGTLDLPIGEQILEVAATLSRDHPDLSMQLREYEYQREVQAGNASASSYLGLADVRIKQKRTDDALALLRDLTLSVGAPFENLAPAVALLEKNGLKQNAANYAREWKTAEPWNPEAVLALGRLTADKALLESVRKSASAEYTLRAASAGNLRDLKSADAGTTELDLLTHESISQQEAEQPFFVLARLRAAEGSADSGVQTKLYAEAIALKPSLHEQRLALAQAAFQNKQEALGLAAWHSFNGPPNIPWLHSPSLKAALDVQPDRMLKVEELMADVLTKRLQYAEAETIYARMLQQSKDAPLLARIGKLKDTVAAAVKLDRFNRSRAPIISNELSQARIVKPMLKGVPLQ